MRIDNKIQDLQKVGFMFSYKFQPHTNWVYLFVLSLIGFEVLLK